MYVPKVGELTKTLLHECHDPPWDKETFQHFMFPFLCYIESQMIYFFLADELRDLFLDFFLLVFFLLYEFFLLFGSLELSFLTEGTIRSKQASRQHIV